MKPKGELTKEEKRIFKELVADLPAAAENIDAFELSILAKYIHELNEIQKEWEKLGRPFLNKHDQIHPLRTDKDKIMGQILKLGDRFGLNPLARGKSTNSIVTGKRAT